MVRRRGRTLCRNRGLTRSLRDTNGVVLLRESSTGRMTPEEPPTTETAPSPLVAALQREHPEWVREVVIAFGETTIIVPRENIVDACLFLKTSPETRFDFLSDICGADRGVEEEPRFEVNYHLFSTTKYHRIRLKVLLNEEDTHVP